MQLTKHSDNDEETANSIPGDATAICDQESNWALLTLPSLGEIG